jgi:hypothetical protein
LQAKVLKIQKCLGFDVCSILPMAVVTGEAVQTNQTATEFDKTNKQLPNSAPNMY